MLVRMIEGRDLYYTGEIISLPDPRGQDWIARGVAEPAVCPECSGKLQEAGCRVYCHNCGYMHNMHW